MSFPPGGLIPHFPEHTGFLHLGTFTQAAPLSGFPTLGTLGTLFKLPDPLGRMHCSFICDPSECLVSLQSMFP